MSEASSPPPLAPPHAWIMEALVDSPDTDAVALAELLMQNTGFWSRSSTARERVAIRFLEEYLASWSSNDGAGPPLSPLPAGETSQMPANGEPIVCQFDLNQSSEDVLQCFLRKLRLLGPRKACKDTTFINGIRQFIEQKRSALPKCFLEQLKDGKCSEKTSPPIKIFETKSVLSDGNDGSRGVCQTSKNHENKVSDENMAKVTESAANNTSTGLNSELDGNVADVMIEHVEVSTSPPPVNNIIPEQNGIESQMQPPPAEIAPDRVQQESLTQPPQDEIASDRDHEIVVEATTSGEDEHQLDVDTENKIIASEKCKFIASQNGINSDLMAGGGTQATQQDLCIKCDEGGQLLICSVNSCPIAVHENCLGSTANFSDSGEFVCPFCYYSRATAAYYDARKKFSLAKKVLSSFMGWGPRLKREASKPSISGQPSDLDRSVRDNNVKEKASRHKEPTKDGTRANSPLDAGNNGMPIGERFFGDSRKRGDSSDGAVKQKANRSVEPTKDGNRANRCINGGSKHIPTKEGLFVDAINKGASVDGAAIHEPKHRFEHTGACSRAFTSGRALRSAPGQSSENFVNDIEHATSSPYLSCSEHDSQRDPGRTSDIAKSPQNEGDTEHVKEPSNDKKRKEKELLAKNRKKTKKDMAGDHVDEIETSSEFQAETSNNCQYVSATEKTCDVSSEVNSEKRKTTVAGVQIHNQVKCPPSRKERKHKRTKAASRHSANSRIQLPLGRRNRLEWTEEEEEILKEAMKNVTHCGRYGGTPWADILEYGSHIFHKTRQPADLRVKWRNIQKKESEVL